jgi:hypothetical protein
MGERRKGKHFTTSGGLVRKVAYLPAELEAELRDLAHRLQRTESDLIREAVATHLRSMRPSIGSGILPSTGGTSPSGRRRAREDGAMPSTEKVRENRLRRKAERQGLRLVKSRRRDADAPDFGLFQVVDEHNRLEIRGGSGPEGMSTLDEIEDLLYRREAGK